MLSLLEAPNQKIRQAAVEETCNNNKNSNNKNELFPHDYIFLRKITFPFIITVFDFRAVLFYEFMVVFAFYSEEIII